MAAKSTYANNAVISALLRNVALQVAAQFISLHTGDPGLAGASEVVGNAYARVASPGFIGPTLGVYPTASGPYQVAWYKTGSPDVAGISLNTLLAT